MIAFILKIVRSITINKVLLWSFTSLAAVTLLTVFENRNQIFSRFSDSPIVNMSGLSFNVGDQTQNLIREYVLSNRDIVGMSVLNADLRQNEATSVFFFGDDKTLTEIDGITRRSGTNRTPLFTNSDERNGEVIKLINGEFSCSPFTTSVASKMYPELNTHVSFICKASIPAYYGYFSGYVAVFIKTPLSTELESQLKLSTEKLATEIYFRDVLPTQFKEKPASAQGFQK